jgi:SNF2 family DNA or RNA helicase
MSERVIRDYQIEGILFLRQHKRAILADDVGLGKTLETLGAIQYPCLIISPKRAFGTWIDEIFALLKSVDDTDIFIYHGTIKQREILAQEILIAQPKFVLSTYAMMQEIQERISVRWKTIVFDEAHMLRNRKAATLYKRAKLFNSERMYLLTATPVVNGAQDYWTLLNLLDRKNFRSYWNFVKKYCIVDEETGTYEIFGTNPLTAGQLNLILNSYMLKRRAEEVLDDLPEFERQFIPLEMTERQRQVYMELANAGMTKLDDGTILVTPTVLSYFTRIRQLLVTPRLIGVQDDGIAIQTLCEELQDLNDKVVIFTPFREAIPYIQQAILKVGYNSYVIAGGMDENRIEHNRLSFLNDGNHSALIATLQMGTSWSVPGIRYSYTLGFEWVPMFHDQSEGRLAGGLRRKTNVVSKYFTHDGTLDQHVRNVLGRKQTWIKLATHPQEFFFPKKVFEK